MVAVKVATVAPREIRVMEMLDGNEAIIHCARDEPRCVIYQKL